MKYQKYDMESYQIYTVKTDKFKNAYIEVNFREDITHVSLAKRFFLTKILQYSTLEYPTKREMTIELENLYNLEFLTNVSRVGMNHFTNFSVDFIHPKFVKEKDYLDQVLLFLFDALQKPNIRDGKFDEEQMQILKERIHVSLDQYKEKPLSCARIMSKENLFGDTEWGKRIYGTHEEIEALTSDDLVLEYQKMWENSYCEICIVGNLDMDEVVKKIAGIFHKSSIVSDPISAIVFNPILPYRQEVVSSTYNQTQLVLYYQWENVSDYERNYVAPLFCRILGSANMTDKLTRYLRIDNSLCYYCGIIFYATDSYANIYVGTSRENVSKALTYISKAVKEMQKGKIDPNYFEQQKEKFLGDLKLREDDIYGLGDMYYMHEVFDRPMPLDYQEWIMKVSLEDIRKFAKKMVLVYQYVLEEGE